MWKTVKRAVWLYFEPLLWILKGSQLCCGDPSEADNRVAYQKLVDSGRRLAPYYADVDYTRM